MDVLEHASAASPADTRTTRRGFARRLGATLAIGLGLAAAPASKAQAAGSNHCCPSNCVLPSGGSCGAGTQKFYCTGLCPSCCICLSGSSCIDSDGHCIC